MKKVLSIVLIILGSLVIVINILSLITNIGILSGDVPYMVGYFFGFATILFLGLGLILWGVRIRKKLKNKKIEKQLFDELLKESEK